MLNLDSPWNLNHCRTEVDADNSTDSKDDDDDSTASDGSRVTVNEETIFMPTSIVLETPVVTTPPSSIALEETPPQKRNVKRKPPIDCHVIIRWSQLSQLMKENMVCSNCGGPICHLERKTVGIATDIHLSCKCGNAASALADRSDYMLDQSETYFIRRERRIDNYELNWRLIMATQLMGESQVGGSIIGTFLDVTREAFRNAWAPMEDALGVQQRKIGQEVVDFNLNLETLGKVGKLCEDGKVRYPVSVSYDMGWQKAKRTYDSISGHGLMIGANTKKVISFQNYSKSCSKCEIHEKKMARHNTPDVPVAKHNCPRNHEGSSKGMEAKAALECLNKIWSHEEISAFIDIVCIDDDATTKAYLSHCFADLDFNEIARPTNTKGEAKTAKKDDKGKLPRDHPVVVFLADLSHRIRSFAKYLYALKPLAKSKSEMNDVDCLRLKRNYAWWIFTGSSMSYDDFKDSALCPVLHHFNDHSKCGTWCHHRDKDTEELAKLKKYRCKKANNQLYLQCLEIIERFSTEERLKECHHTTNSQKNEAMNKSIMRYVPKDQTYGRSMALTSRLNLSVSIDSLGHARYYERLFTKMKFKHTELTFSGLRRMWRKKEYGRMYQGRKEVKKMRRIQQREKMIEGIRKMEADVVKGMAYSSGIRIQGDDEGKEEGELDCQAPATKKARTKRTSSSKSTTRESNQEGCKCGQRDHKRITSSKCPWKGLCAEEVSAKYEQRMKQQKMSISSFSECTAEPCANGTAVNAQSSSKYMAPMRTLYVPHVNTHLVQLLCTIVQK
jgi:hypothetical protein